MLQKYWESYIASGFTLAIWCVDFVATRDICFPKKIESILLQNLTFTYNSTVRATLLSLM